MSDDLLANITYAVLAAIGLFGLGAAGAVLLVKWLERQRIGPKR
jgi:hypothetical protein